MSYLDSTHFHTPTILKDVTATIVERDWGNMPCIATVPHGNMIYLSGGEKNDKELILTATQVSFYSNYILNPQQKLIIT